MDVKFIVSLAKFYINAVTETDCYCGGGGGG